MANESNKELFARHGLKNTRHRNQVLEILQQADRPQTTERVYLKLKELDCPISFSTVYRILDAFAESGLAERSSMAGEAGTVFELRRGHHGHRLFCTGCNRMVPIEGCPLEQYEKALEKQTDFQITAHRLEMFGVCPECKGKVRPC